MIRVGAAVFLIGFGVLTALFGVGFIVKEPCTALGACVLDGGVGAGFVVFGIWGVVNGLHRLLALGWRLQ